MYENEKAIGSRRVIDGCYVEKLPGNLYRVTRKDDPNCTEVLTGDAYERLWVKNCPCDMHFVTKPELTLRR